MVGKWTVGFNWLNFLSQQQPQMHTLAYQLIKPNFQEAHSSSLNSVQYHAQDVQCEQYLHRFKSFFL